MTAPTPSTQIDLQTLLDELYSMRRSGRRRGLEGMQALFDALGLSTDGVPAVQIAGTNGKGSTAAFLASILRHAGLKVGLFTSPHLHTYSERFRIDGAPVSADALAPVLQRTMHAARQLTPPALFFEVTTAVGFQLFKDAQVDIAVFEVGLGGRLDPTTFLPARLSVITSIGLEHTQWLGDTLAKIASEKAGILRPDVPYISGVESAEAKGAIESVARQVGAGKGAWYGEHFGLEASDERSCREVSVWAAGRRFEGLRPGLHGAFQHRNLSLSVAAACELQRAGWSISSGAIHDGVESVDWSGRLQRILVQEGTLWLDGAHNPQACEVIADEFSRKNQTCRVLFSCAEDKNVVSMLRALHPVASSLTLCPFVGGRAMSEEALMKAAHEANIQVQTRWFSSSSQALTGLLGEREDEDILIVGSLFLVGECLSWLRTYTSHVR